MLSRSAYCLFYRSLFILAEALAGRVLYKMLTNFSPACKRVTQTRWGCSRGQFMGGNLLGLSRTGKRDRARGGAAHVAYRMLTVKMWPTDR